MNLINKMSATTFYPLQMRSCIRFIQRSLYFKLTVRTAMWCAVVFCANVYTLQIVRKDLLEKHIFGCQLASTSLNIASKCPKLWRKKTNQMHKILFAVWDGSECRYLQNVTYSLLTYELKHFTWPRETSFSWYHFNISYRQTKTETAQFNFVAFSSDFKSFNKCFPFSVVEIRWKKMI